MSSSDSWTSVGSEVGEEGSAPIDEEDNVHNPARAPSSQPSVGSGPCTEHSVDLANGGASKLGANFACIHLGNGDSSCAS